MKTIALAGLLAISALSANAARAESLCDTCGHVQAVKKETRKGQGGAVGIVGGAVVGGLIGNQFGHGNGKALATVGGAAAGGFAGNEVQKHVTSKDVWVTSVKMKDGSVRKFEQAAAPAWKAGAVVKLHGKTIVRA